MSTVLSILIGMTIAGPVVIVTSLTGQNEALCKALGGSYKPTPVPGEVCPGGAWSALVGVRPTPR